MSGINRSKSQNATPEELRLRHLRRMWHNKNLTRLAELVWPELKGKIAIRNNARDRPPRDRIPGVPLGYKCLLVDGENLGDRPRILARGDSYRGIARDLAALLRSRGIDPKNPGTIKRKRPNKQQRERMKREQGGEPTATGE